MRKVIYVRGAMVLILACALWSLNSALAGQNEFWSQSFYEFLEEYHAKKETLGEEAFELWKNNCKGKKVRWKGWIEEICHDYYLNEYRIKIQTHWGISIETNRPEEALSGWRMIARIPEWRASEVQRLKIDQKVRIVAIIEDIYYNYEVVVKNARLLKPQEVGEVENKLVKSLEFTTIEKGFFSGFTEKKNWAIRTQEQWLKLWNMHTSTRIPHPPSPVIDFARDMVLAVFIGQKPTGGFSVEIIRVEKKEDTIVVFFRETEPAPEATVTAVLTQPYHIIKIEKTNLPVIFKNIEESTKMAIPNNLTKIREIINSPYNYQGKMVTIKGEYRGWNLPSEFKDLPLARKTKDDWILTDGTGCIYVSGGELEGKSLTPPREDIKYIIIAKGIVRLAPLEKNSTLKGAYIEPLEIIKTTQPIFKSGIRPPTPREKEYLKEKIKKINTPEELEEFNKGK